MRTQTLSQAVASSADPQRAADGVDLLRDVVPAQFLKKLSGEQARILAVILAGSQYLTELMVAHPDWLAPLLETDFLNFPRQAQGLRREVDQWLKPMLRGHDYEAAFAALRQFKQREMLRIAARDLSRLADALEITREISRVADVCLDTACRVCQQNLSQRMGRPYHLDANGQWQESQFCVLGLGKLGGQELTVESAPTHLARHA